MRTLNTKFTSIDDLKAYIQEHDIAREEQILLQIFTGNCNESFIKVLIKELVSLIPHIKIIGSTTDGEIMADVVSDFETVLSFSLFDETMIKTYATAKSTSCTKTAENLIQQFDKKKKPRVAISFVDGITTNGEAFLNAFTEYDSNLIVSGGLAGDNASFVQTLVFTEKEVLKTGAVVALLYNDNLHIHTKANFGWQSIGKTLQVTKAKDNVVYEIDGMTPVDLYAKYLGHAITAKLPKTGIEFPLIMRRGSLDIARAVIGKNDDGSLIFAGNMSAGDKVKFGYGNIESIVAGGNGVYEELSKIPSESIFIYSCMARKALMGKNIATELRLLTNIAPLSGFFTYGEFFTNIKNGRNELLNQTMTILSLSEKAHTPKQETETIKPLYLVNENLTSLALSHLVTQTSIELEEINNSLAEKIQEEIVKNINKDEKLLQQSRMAQLGEMISMIAHQWRQPLGAIAASSIDLKMKIAFSSFDLETKEGQKRCETYFDEQLSNIETYVQNLTHTIDDFRNFYKPNKEKKILNINEPIRKSLAIIEATVKSSGIEIITDFKSEKICELYDSELMQVFLNIIKNAQDNFKEKEIKNARIRIETIDTKEGVKVEISDNGGGIPEDIMIKIFDPYFSTKDEKNGTGLGLYMSKTIVEEHHEGELSVVNQAQGVCFTVEIRA